MRSRRYLAMFTCLLVSACAGDSYESAGGGGEEPAQAAMEGGDDAALVALVDYYETHYNMHHASMVADVFQDTESGGLWADGAVTNGRDAIGAYLEGQMPASPTLELTPTEHMMFGDVAVGHGTYSVESTPPGMDAQTLSGSWLASYHKQEDGTWKLGYVLSNYDGEWPEGQMRGAVDDEAPEENGTMGDMIAGYETHWNLGHPSMVADIYTEDAVVSFSGRASVSGRTAISAVLTERMDQGATNIDIHEVGTVELGEGWAMDGGWYQINAGDGDEMMQGGSFMSLLKQQDDGSWQIHWAVTNGFPAAAVSDGM